MTENNENAYGIHPIDDLYQMTMDQITMGLDWEDFKKLPINDWQYAFFYFERLFLGKHICRIENSRFSSDECSNLFILVHFEEDMEGYAEGEIDIMNYFLYLLEDELWSPVGRDLQLSDIDLDLLDAILNAGVKPLDSSETRLMRACEAAEREKGESER